MAYTGQKVGVPLGKGGLLTDDSSDQIPLTAMIQAFNCSMEYGYLENEGGSRFWNTSALPAGVSCFYDWWPDPYLQRCMALTADGQITRFDGPASPMLIAPTDPLQTNLTITGQPYMVEGGAEQDGKPKKLFIFTGNNPIQVITGDLTTRHNIQGASPDWATPWIVVNQDPSGTQPNGFPNVGIIYKQSLWCFMGHRAYSSSAIDHEDFSNFATYATYSIYPGEGDNVVAAWIFMGRLFVAKHPNGIYYLEDSDPNNIFFQKLSPFWGVASAHSFCLGQDEIFVANANGTITSGKATFQLGDITQADLIRSLRCEDYFHESFLEDGRTTRWAIFDEAKKKAYFSYQSTGGQGIDRIVTIDMNTDKYRIAVSDKDAGQGMTCLGVMKDVRGKKRPFYGSSNGYIYALDQRDRQIVNPGGTAAYNLVVQTPHSDLGVDQDKIFDFVELDFVPTGTWDLPVDVYIDSVYSQTVTFRLGRGEGLDGSGAPAFQLDRSRFPTENGTYTQSRKLDRRGRTISFVIQEGVALHDIKLRTLRVLFRTGGQDAKGGSANS